MEQNQAITMSEAIERYRKTHLLTDRAVLRYGLTVGSDCITIPVFDREGRKLFSKSRLFSGPDKYRYEKGSTMALFNADAILPETEEVWIVEGEFDAIALQEWFDCNKKMFSCAVTSTGGAGSWNEEWNAMLEGKKTMVLLDSDKAGINGSMRLWEKIGRNVEIRRIVKYKDVCECLYADSEKDFELTHTKSAIPDVFEYRTISDERTQRAKVSMIRHYFSCMNDLEAYGMHDVGDVAYFNAFRDLMRKMLDREKPKRKVKADYSGAESDLEKVRMIPVSNFVKFDSSGLAPCVFHSDRNPSMQWNGTSHPNPKLRNTVKCFSCGKFGGVIDVVMAINGISFPEAVELLRKNI